MAKAKKFFKEAAKEAAVKAAAQAQLEAEQKAAQAEEEELAFREHLRADPYSTLDVLLIMALAEKFHPGKSFSEVLSGKPRKFLDVVYGLVTYCKPAVLGTIVHPVMKATHPFKALQERYDTYEKLEGATEEFLEERYHGMFIHHGVIYPVKLWAEDKAAFEFGMAKEEQLYRMIAHNAAVMLGLSEIQCHVLLFAHWGFSHRMASVGHKVVDIEEAFEDLEAQEQRTIFIEE